MKKFEILDMTEAPFLKKIMIFSVPLMLTGVLQLIYNAADLIVVGRFSGNECLAAVGSTGALINLILNLFIGLSTGAGVVAAHCIGAGNKERTSNCVHTAMTVSVISGILVGFIGFFFAHDFLSLMDTPDNVIDLATVYLKIIFIGAPGVMIYNFGAAILRSTGDTKRPLFFLAVTGLLNVILNLVFVLVFHMNVDGVAYATIISEYLSSILIVLTLTRLENECRLDFKELKIHMSELKEIAKIGLPAGLQGSLFSISNVLIQSTINSFGSVAMAGNTAASNAESLIFITSNAISQTAMTFASQNMGAKKYKNLNKIFGICMVFTISTSILLAALVLLFPEAIMSIFSDDPEVIEVAKDRLLFIMSTYFTCSMMDIAGYELRGMGKSLEPMIITLVGVCGIRILWLYLIFPMNPVLENVYISYPVSWVVTLIALLICYFVHIHKLKKITSE